MEKKTKDFLEFDDRHIYIMIIRHEQRKLNHEEFLKSPSVCIQFCTDQHKSNNVQILQTKQVVAAATVVYLRFHHIKNGKWLEILGHRIEVSAFSEKLPKSVWNPRATVAPTSYRLSKFQHVLSINLPGGFLILSAAGQCFSPK